MRPVKRSRRIAAIAAALLLAPLLVPLAPAPAGAQSTGTVLFSDDFSNPAAGRLLKASYAPSDYTVG